MTLKICLNLSLSGHFWSVYDSYGRTLYYLFQPIAQHFLTLFQSKKHIFNMLFLCWIRLVQRMPVHSGSIQPSIMTFDYLYNFHAEMEVPCNDWHYVQQYMSNVNAMVEHFITLKMDRNLSLLSVFGALRHRSPTSKAVKQ